MELLSQGISVLRGTNKAQATVRENLEGIMVALDRRLMDTETSPGSSQANKSEQGSKQNGMQLEGLPGNAAEQQSEEASNQQLLFLAWSTVLREVNPKSQKPLKGAVLLGHGLQNHPK